MAEIKDKVVTVESLSALHEHNKSEYMTKVNPTCSGTMTMNGDGKFSGNGTFNGNVDAGSLTVASKIKLVPTGNSLDIVFLSE